MDNKNIQLDLCVQKDIMGYKQNPELENCMCLLCISVMPHTFLDCIYLQGMDKQYNELLMCLAISS